MSEQKKPKPADPEIHAVTETISVPTHGGGVVLQKRERVVMHRR